MNSFRDEDIDAAALRMRERENLKTIARQENQIQKLRAALRALTQDSQTEDDDNEESEVSRTSLSSDIDEPDEEMEMNSTDDDDSIQTEPPFFDKLDAVYRCNLCAWEVIDGLCQHCCAKYPSETFSTHDEYHVEHLSPNTISERMLIHSNTNEDLLRSVTTDYQVLRSDRRMPPRGSTPLRAIPSTVTIPEYYLHMHDEYLELLARGATRLMCETFKLRFSNQEGIIAYADEELFQEFAGPTMQGAYKWRIYLGRRIVLEESDLDGGQFMEDVLEEAMIFPFCRRGAKCTDECKWETVKNPLDIWVTRPVCGVVHGDDEDADSYCHAAPDEDSDVELEVPSIYRNEYEDNSSDEMDEDMLFEEQANEDNDAGETIDPCAPDSEYVDCDEIISMEEEELEAVASISQDGARDEVLYDSADSDSDFDDDEMLSGDEAVIHFSC